MQCAIAEFDSGSSASTSKNQRSNEALGATTEAPQDAQAGALHPSLDEQPGLASPGHDKMVKDGIHTVSNSFQTIDQVASAVMPAGEVMPLMQPNAAPAAAMQPGLDSSPGLAKLAAQDKYGRWIRVKEVKERQKKLKLTRTVPAKRRRKPRQSAAINIRSPWK